MRDKFLNSLKHQEISRESNGHMRWLGRVR
jgi:hypothetical protein